MLCCKVPSCTFSGVNLTKHVRCKHGISSKEYQQIYNTEVKEKFIRNPDIYNKPCPIHGCNESFSSDNTLNRHLNDSLETKHSHILCNESNSKMWAECKVEIEDENGNKKICGFRHNDIRKHLKKVHNINSKDYNRQLFCDDYLEKRKHLKRKEKEKNFACQSCNKKFTTEKQLLEHNERHKYTIKCEIPGCDFIGADLTQHLLHKHNLTAMQYKQLYNVEEIKEKLKLKTNLDIYKIICPAVECGERFSSENALNFHIRCTKDAKHSHLIYNETNKDDWVECKFEGFRRMDLRRHLKLVHNLTKEQYGFEVYSENYKKKQLQKFAEAGAHAKRKEKEKIFVCKICNNAAFTTERQLKFHEIDEHSINCNESNRDDWVQCTLCWHKRMNKIDSHLRKKHGISTEQYDGDLLSKNYLKKVIENGTKAKFTVNDRIYRHKCKIENCNNIIDGKALICDLCKEKIEKEKREIQFMGKIENIDFIRCKLKKEDNSICNWLAKDLTEHLISHGYTNDQYEKEFNSLAVCKNLRKDIMNENKHIEESEIFKLILNGAKNGNIKD